MKTKFKLTIEVIYDVDSKDYKTDIVDEMIKNDTEQLKETIIFDIEDFFLNKSVKCKLEEVK